MDKYIVFDCCKAGKAIIASAPYLSHRIPLLKMGCMTDKLGREENITSRCCPFGSAQTYARFVLTINNQ